MFSKPSIIFLFCLIILIQTSFAQPALPEILHKANQQREIYEETFKNIFARERKNYQTFKGDGSIKKSFQVESNFLVLQSYKNADVITEYRNVTKFDGKKVTGAEQNAERFFADLLNSKSVNEELIRIQNQSSNFEGDLLITDLTLRQSPVLAEHIRPDFDFQLVGLENDQYLIKYQQVKKSKYVLINDLDSTETKLTMDFGISLPKSIKEINAQVRGTIWIDSKSFQIKAEKRELTIQPENSIQPIIVFQVEFEFGKESFDILVPKRISLESYLLKIKNNELYSIKDAQISFEYSEFTCLDVNVKTSGILEPIVIDKKKQE